MTSDLYLFETPYKRHAKDVRRRWRKSYYIILMRKRVNREACIFARHLSAIRRGHFLGHNLSESEKMIRRRKPSKLYVSEIGLTGR